MFDAGLLAIGDVRDEINLNTQKAISRIQQLEYTPANLASVIASGLPYDTDTNYIYAVRATYVEADIAVDGTYTVSDHGIEFYTASSSVPPITETIYGDNLKDKLRTDVLTISAQSLSSTQQAQVRTNIGLGAASTKAVANNLTTAAAGTAVLDAYQGKVLYDQIGYASAISDADNASYRFNFVNANTLHTPYKEGLTRSTEGWILTLRTGSSSSYNTQICIPVGQNNFYIRRINGGSWSAWESLYDQMGSLIFAYMDIGTTGKTIGTAFEVDLPTGFTSSNIRMITSSYLYALNSNLYTETAYDSSTASFRIVATSSGKLNITPTGGISTAGTLRVVLARVD
jgi:hypothetical protein